MENMEVENWMRVYELAKNLNKYLEKNCAVECKYFVVKKI